MALQTQAFKTKTIMKPKKNPGANLPYWGVAIDMGYSGVKVFSANSYVAFPSYAKKIPYGTADKSIGHIDDKTIIYRDKENEYFVGQTAMNEAKETDSSASNLYTRDRCLKPEFKVMLATGIALCSTKNQYGDPTGKPLVITTGLPPAYLEDDKEQLKETFAGSYEFSLKVGSKDWVDYKFEIKLENVDVLSQPIGTLFSVAHDCNGGFVPYSEKLFSSNVVIFDPGFGTLDFFVLKNNLIDSSMSQSRDDLGMKRVFEETAKLIKEHHKINCSVHNIVSALPDGTIKYINRKERISKNIVFAEELEEASEMVCKEALEYLDASFDYLYNIDYLIVTGGTGDAWYSQIVNYYNGMLSTLKILIGNSSDSNIPCIFSNVRGYYMFMFKKMKSKQVK